MALHYAKTCGKSDEKNGNGEWSDLDESDNASLKAYDSFADDATVANNILLYEVYLI